MQSSVYSKKKKLSSYLLTWLFWGKLVIYPLQSPQWGVWFPQVAFSQYMSWYGSYLKTETISHSLGYLIQYYATNTTSETSFTVMNE